MVARPKTIAKPSSPMVARLKNHRGQWLIDQKPLKKIGTNGFFQTIHSMAMVTLKTIDVSQWQQSQSKNSLPWEIKQTNHHINKIYQICFFPQTKPNFTSLYRFLEILDPFCHTAGKLYQRCKRLSKTAQCSWVNINFRQLIAHCTLHVGAVHDALDKIGLFQSVCGQFKFQKQFFVVNRDF